MSLSLMLFHSITILSNTAGPHCSCSYSTVVVVVVVELRFLQGVQGVSVAASPVLATIGMSVCLSVRPSVRHTLTLCEKDAS